MSSDVSRVSLPESGWQISVDRGPDWLFVRLHPPENHLLEPIGVAGGIWELMQQHLVSRIVLEMDEVSRLTSQMMGELVLLHKRVHTTGGIMRLSGLASRHHEVLRIARLDGRFPHFMHRKDAVRGSLPERSVVPQV